MHNEVCFDAVSSCCSMNASDTNVQSSTFSGEAKTENGNIEELNSEIFKFGISQPDSPKDSETLPKLLCNSCKARELAVAVCKDCKDSLLCLNCVSAHRFMNCFDGHRIESNPDYTNSVAETNGVQPCEDVILQQIFECSRYCAMLNDLLVGLAHILSSVKTRTNELVQDVIDVTKTLKFTELLSMQTRSEDQIHQIIKLAIKIAVNFKDLYEFVAHDSRKHSFLRCKLSEILSDRQRLLAKFLKEEEHANIDDINKTANSNCAPGLDAVTKFCRPDDFDLFRNSSSSAVSFTNGQSLLWPDGADDAVNGIDGDLSTGFLASADCLAVTSAAELLLGNHNFFSNRQSCKQSATATTVLSSKHINESTVNNLLDLINIQHAISQKAPQVNIGKDGNVYVNNEKTSFTVPSNGTVVPSNIHREPVDSGMPVSPNICCSIINGAATLSDHSSRSVTPLDDRFFPNGLRPSTSALPTPSLCGSSCDVISAQPIPPCNASPSVIAANNTGFSTLSIHSYPGGGNLNPPVRFNGKMTPMQIRHKFGSLGPAKSQFNSPHGFCLGLDEEIIIADTNNHRIQVFDKCGEFKYQFGVPGRDEGQLWYPRKVVVMRHNGKFVVCDRGNERSRMQLFSKNGHFIKKIAIRYIDIVAGLAITPQGHIVAVDSVSPTVFCISESGDLLKWFDCSDYMREPSDIVINGKEYFVCDFKGHCVVVFNEDGVFLRRIGCENVTNFPNGIDISDAGDILVGDSHGNRFHVAVFSRDGSLLSEFECPYVKVSRCCGLKITSDGYIVTLAKNNHHVLVLNTLFIA